MEPVRKETVFDCQDHHAVAKLRDLDLMEPRRPSRFALPE
jgi:hypothetical protein